MIFSLTKNDARARVVIISFSIIVFVAVTVLERVTLDVDLGFDKKILPFINAMINTVVALLLIGGLITAKNGKYEIHRKIMTTALLLSVLFLVVYILHHLFSGSTLYGDIDKNGIVTDVEKMQAGFARKIYIFLLSTHIILAGISLPFILFTAYRALISENAKHRKMAKYTWPMWFYVAATGPIVYWMISPYY
jgi:putative membrane protein